MQLDSLYEIRAYDTLMAPVTGMVLPVQARNVFLEEAEGAWRVTDLFQLRNEEDRTLVASENGAVWRYPLPEEARDPSAIQGGLALEAIDFVDGHVVVDAAVPPGEHLVVVQYTVPDPFLTLPLPGSTEALEVLVREPAPPLRAPLLTPAASVELEPGTTYRHFTGVGMSDQVVELMEGVEARPPPVRGVAVLLALLLAGVGTWAVQSGGDALAAEGPGHVESRRSLLVQVARLDEDFARRAGPSPEEQGAYEARRRELLRRIRSAS